MKLRDAQAEVNRATLRLHFAQRDVSKYTAMAMRAAGERDVSDQVQRCAACRDPVPFGHPVACAECASHDGCDLAADLVADWRDKQRALGRLDAQTLTMLETLIDDLR